MEVSEETLPFYFIFCAAATLHYFRSMCDQAQVAKTEYTRFKEWAQESSSRMPSTVQPGSTLWDVVPVTQQFYYSPLRPREIRLWRVSCSGKPKRFQSELILVSLDSAPSYVAISYSWGDPATVSIIPCGSHQHIPLTDSVSVILDTLLDDGEILLLWVDAICINQANLKEKDQQLLLMADIYRRAKQEAVILGRAGDGSDIAMDFIVPLEQAIGELRSCQKQVSAECVVLRTGHAFPDPTWTSLSKLFSRRWFSRIWVVQEVCVGCSPVFICGDRAVDWSSISSLAMKILTLGLDVLFTNYGDHLVRPVPDGFNYLATMFEARCVVQNNEEEPLQEALLGLHHLNATDPRDKIFAVLGIACDAGGEALQPKYEMSISDVYCQVARYLLLRDPQIIILNRAGIGIPRTFSELPSWAPDWTCSSTMSFGSNFRTSKYQAALYTHPNVQPGPGFRDLAFTGLLIDIITEVGLTREGILGEAASHESESQLQKSIESWLKNAEEITARLCPMASCESWEEIPYHGSEHESLFEAFWRTLIANYTFRTGPVSSKFEECYVSFRRYLRAPETVNHPSVGTAAMAYSSAFSLATRGRRFLTTRGGFIGLASSGIRCGDMVSLFAGGVTPFILRPENREDGRACFKLIGEAYIHGLMNGEGLSMGEFQQILLT